MATSLADGNLAIEEVTTLSAAYKVGMSAVARPLAWQLGPTQMPQLDAKACNLVAHLLARLCHALGAL